MNEIPKRASVESQRRARNDLALTQETAQWFTQLPPAIQPRALVKEIPRIANDLCRRWAMPAACQAYFDDLLIDRRGNRRGFTMRIASELATLKNHYETQVHPAPQSWWDHLAV
jgi:hypothetical protein